MSKLAKTLGKIAALMRKDDTLPKLIKELRENCRHEVSIGYSFLGDANDGGGEACCLVCGLVEHYNECVPNDPRYCFNKLGGRETKFIEREVYEMLKERRLLVIPQQDDNPFL